MMALPVLDDHVFRVRTEKLKAANGSGTNRSAGNSRDELKASGIKAA
jgi:stalled ribosome alternative rescue factor ArfA